jgi:hypothetical protein
LLFIYLISQRFSLDDLDERKHIRRLENMQARVLGRTVQQRERDSKRVAASFAWAPRHGRPAAPSRHQRDEPHRTCPSPRRGAQRQGPKFIVFGVVIQLQVSLAIFIIFIFPGHKLHFHFNGSYTTDFTH